MKNFIYSGQSISFTAKEPLLSGQAYLLGNAFGVVASSLQPGQSGELFIRGAFRLPKDPTKKMSLAQKVFWDNDKKFLTTNEADKDPKLVAVGISGEESDKDDIICILNGVAL